MPHLPRGAKAGTTLIQWCASVLAVSGCAPGAGQGRGGAPVVVLAAAARDRMGQVFARFNQHWNELGDLNTLERMLGTIRPTQREYLGCLQGEIDGDTVRVDGSVPATGMKQLQLAVTGSCDSVPRLVGTWHSHPYRADPQNLPIKERRLSAQDLETFGSSPYAVTIVIWDVDSLDTAVRWHGKVVHPARVISWR
jgi:proteasome lid subunit RPN8/RPN11